MGVDRHLVHAEGEQQALEQAVRQVAGVVDITRNGAGYVVEAKQDLRGEVASAIITSGGKLLAQAEKLGVSMNIENIFFNGYLMSPRRATTP